MTTKINKKPKYNFFYKPYYERKENSPKYIIIHIISSIILYILIKKYTDELLSDSNCNCVLEKYIVDIKKTSINLIIIITIINVLKLLKTKPNIILCLSIINLILIISLIINWLNINSNIKKNNCICAYTTTNIIINIIIWLQLTIYVFVIFMIILVAISG